MNKTAIILFAHLPDFEARVKSFSGFSSKKATQKISSVLTQHFYKLANQSTADSFLIDSYHQKGKSFGERISNAFADVYAKGYENVICIGNDCPELNLTQLQSAIIAVEKGNVVLGPTQDGGSYLMGIPKRDFNKSGFNAVKWQTKQTFKSLNSLFKNNKSSIIKTQVLIDIDNSKDLSSYISVNFLVKIILSIVKKFEPKDTLYLPTSFLSLILSQTLLFRGPPNFSISN